MKSETLLANAHRFLREALRKSKEGRIIFLHGSAWPAMLNPQWREYVLANLHPTVFGAEFYPPDELDGCWVFSAKSKSEVHRLATADLEDYIVDEEPVERGFLPFFQRNTRTIGIWIAAGAIALRVFISFFYSVSGARAADTHLEATAL